MKQVKNLQNKSVNQLKSLNNRVFSSNVLQNENLNYIVGAIVAVLCVAVVQGHLKVPKVFNTTVFRAIHLLVIVVVARHNLVLALILLTGYMVVSHYGGLEGFDARENDKDRDARGNDLDSCFTTSNTCMKDAEKKMNSCDDALTTCLNKNNNASCKKDKDCWGYCDSGEVNCLRNGKNPGTKDCPNFGGEARCNNSVCVCTISRPELSYGHG